MKRIRVYIQGKFGSRVLVSAEVVRDNGKTVLVRLPGGAEISRHKEKHMPEGTRRELEEASDGKV